MPYTQNLEDSSASAEVPRGRRGGRSAALPRIGPLRWRRSSDMPKLSATMKDGVLQQVAEEGRRQGLSRRPDRRGRDRQGEHGLQVVRRRRPAQAAWSRKATRSSSARRSRSSARPARTSPRWSRRRRPRRWRRREAGRGCARPEARARGQARPGRQARARSGQRSGCRARAEARARAGADAEARRGARRPARARSRGSVGNQGARVAARATLAIELGIDLRNVQGTGPGGRIVERDVKAAAEGGANGAAAVDWHAAEEAPPDRRAARVGDRAACPPRSSPIGAARPGPLRPPRPRTIVKPLSNMRQDDRARA